MTWQIFLFISIITYAVAVLTQRVLMKNEKSNAYAYSVVSQLLTGSVIGVFGILAGKLSFTNMQLVASNLIFATVLYGASNIFIFSALKIIEASEFTIIFSSRILFTIFASTLFLKEGLSPFQFLGVVFILSAVVLVTLKSNKLTLKKGVIFALLAAICFGLANTNDRYALKYVELYSYVTLAYFFPAIFTLMIAPKSIYHMKYFLKLTTLTKVIFMCVVYAISSITFFSALQMNSNSSQTTSISLLSVIVIVILSALFLRDRSNLLRKIIGALLSIIGSIILVK